MSTDSAPTDKVHGSDNSRPPEEPSRFNRVTETLESSASDPAPDPFNPSSLCLGQDFTTSVAVKKVLTTVPCRKPSRHEFVRVRPGEGWRLETAAFEDRVARETYLVDRTLWPELAGEIYPVCLFLTINRQQDVFFWPVKLPSPDGRSNHWNDSALAAARLAESCWVRVAANMLAGLYDTFQAGGDLPDPQWPELSIQEVLRLCFRDRFIRDSDHPALKALRGES